MWLAKLGKEMLLSDERAFVGRKEIRALLKRLRGRLEKLIVFFICVEESVYYTKKVGRA